MIDAAKAHHAAAGQRGIGDLRVAPQAQVVVARRQQVIVDRTVRLMAGGTTFPQGFVDEYKGSGLIAVALSTRLIKSRKRQTARWFVNVHAMRVVALHTVQLPFDHGMPVRQAKLRMNFLVTGEARRRIATGIDDGFPAPASQSDMFTARAVTGFTARLTFHREIRDVEPRVRTGEEGAADIGMAIEANLIADEAGARNPGNVA